MAQLDERALGVYVHYPLCAYRCGYCDFAIITPDKLDADFPQRGYADQVIAELDARAAPLRDRRLDSVYFGGGTPSLWPADQLGRVLGRVLDSFEHVAHGAVEVTVEANPESLGDAQLAALADVGVNRLSLGVQSLDDSKLRALTRQHDALSAARVVERARAYGFDNISCDLILGLAPRPDAAAGDEPLDRDALVAAHCEEVARMAALGIEHISTYGLTLSRGSAMFRAGERPVDDDTCAALLDGGREALARAGFAQYEVSNFAVAPRWRSRHNLLVWNGLPYLGLGASAHGAGVAAADGSVVRVANPPFRRYLGAAMEAGPPPHVAGARVREVDPQTAQEEVLMVGLRTREGVDRERFALRFGVDPLRGRQRAVETLVAAGLLELTPQRLRATARGIWLADELALRLMR